MEKNAWFQFDEGLISARAALRYKKWYEGVCDGGHSGPKVWARRQEAMKAKVREDVIREMNELRLLQLAKNANDRQSRRRSL